MDMDMDMELNKILLNMPRPKGSPNKLTSAIKDKLGDILSEAIESLDIKEMSKGERLPIYQKILMNLIGMLILLSGKMKIFLKL